MTHILAPTMMKMVVDVAMKMPMPERMYLRHRRRASSDGVNRR